MVGVLADAALCLAPLKVPAGSYIPWHRPLFFFFIISFCRCHRIFCRCPPTCNTRSTSGTWRAASHTSTSQTPRTSRGPPLRPPSCFFIFFLRVVLTRLLRPIPIHCSEVLFSRIAATVSSAANSKHHKHWHRRFVLRGKDWLCFLGVISVHEFWVFWTKEGQPGAKTKEEWARLWCHECFRCGILLPKNIWSQ